MEAKVETLFKNSASYDDLYAQYASVIFNLTDYDFLEALHTDRDVKKRWRNDRTLSGLIPLLFY
jgi:hypothetical protein